MARLGTSITLCQNYEEEVQQRLERVAYYDSLTSLPNSILFSDSLRQAVVRASSSNTWMALVHLDVDDFRRFNAEHGEQTGNRVLVALVSVPFLPAFFMPYTLIVAESSDFPCHVGYQTLMDLKVVWKRE